MLAADLDELRRAPRHAATATNRDGVANTAARRAPSSHPSPSWATGRGQLANVCGSASGNTSIGDAESARSSAATERDVDRLTHGWRDEPRHARVSH